MFVRKSQQIDSLEGESTASRDKSLVTDYSPSSNNKTRTVITVASHAVERMMLYGSGAGINAARRAQQLAPVVIPRNSSYLGTLVDDLVTKVSWRFLPDLLPCLAQMLWSTCPAWLS